MNQERQVERLLWNIREAAQALNVSTRTIWKYSKDGYIPSIKIGRSTRFCKKQLEQFIDDNLKYKTPENKKNVNA